MRRVEQLAAEGYHKGEIAERVGIKNVTTFTARLVRASQQTGKPIPAFKPRSRAPARKRVEAIQIKRRGKGDAYGVNIPQEPLERLGVGPGDAMVVMVKPRRIVLSRADDVGSARSEPRPPRLIRNRQRRPN
jgi:hypothetical protein